MKETDGELISTLLDGEIASKAHRATVEKLFEGGRDASKTFGRYRLIGDLMRDESAHVVAVADRVRDALRDEPAIVAPRRTVRWLRPVAGAALAASVAAAAIVVAPQLLDSGPLATSEALVATPTAATPPTFVTALAEPPGGAVAQMDGSDDRRTGIESSRWDTLDGTLEDRLDRLVIEHHEFGGRTGINGPVAHIGFVSYDTR